MQTQTCASVNPREQGGETAPSTILSDRLLPVIPACETHIDSSKSNTEKLIARGELAIVRIGRKRLIRESEIARFIADAERRTAAAMQRVPQIRSAA